MLRPEQGKQCLPVDPQFQPLVPRGGELLAGRILKLGASSTALGLDANQPRRKYFEFVSPLTAAGLALPFHRGEKLRLGKVNHSGSHSQSEGALGS